MKVGIFGGTFNPPHNTHIQIAVAAKSQLSLDKLIVLPCGIPPHKTCDVTASDRFAMTKAAFGDIAEVSDFEIAKEGASYTVETLRHFKSEYPTAQLFLIMGGDSYENFGSWYCPEEIARLATLAVAERRDNTSVRHNLYQNFNAETVFLNVTPNDVSSTEIRLRYEFGLPNADFVPAAVDEYVLQNNLYCKFREIAQKLKTYLDEKRFMHTFYVVKRGLQLAGEQDDVDVVFLSCLLHDCAKNIPESKYADYGFTAPADMPKPIIHSFLGALVAEKDFGVTDNDVLAAIAYHTTGCPDMTRLQKIVYVADKTEETRPYPLEHLLKGNLDDQLVSCLAEANSYTVARHGADEYYLSKQTLDYYCKKH